MIQLLGAHTFGQSHCIPLFKGDETGFTTFLQRSISLACLPNKKKGQKSDGYTSPSLRYFTFEQSGQETPLKTYEKQSLRPSARFKKYCCRSLLWNFSAKEAKYISSKAINVFKSEGKISSMTVVFKSLELVNHLEEKSQPLQAILLIPFNILFFSVSLVTFWTSFMSSLKDQGLGVVVFALQKFKKIHFCDLSLNVLAWDDIKNSCYLTKDGNVFSSSFFARYSSFLSLKA